MTKLPSDVLKTLKLFRVDGVAQVLTPFGDDERGKFDRLCKYRMVEDDGGQYAATKQGQELLRSFDGVTEN